MENIQDREKLKQVKNVGSRISLRDGDSELYDNSYDFEILKYY